MPTKPFSGVTDDTTTLLGQVRLPLTFGTRENYCTEQIDFDIAYIGLPYNATLSYPALAKFMAVTDHAYNMFKLPGNADTITIHGQVQEALHSIETVYKAAALANPSDEDAEEDYEKPTKKKQLFSQEKTATKQVSLDANNLGARVTIGAGLPIK